MQTKTDISYGVVPLFKEGDTWKVLLVHQISHRGGKNTFWILPKGHADPGESGIDAALRELKEETGVTAVTLQGERSFDVHYSFVHQGVRIEKTVQFYIGICDMMDTHITQPEEIITAGWFSLEAAKKKVSHKNTREVLEAVEQIL